MTEPHPLGRHVEHDERSRAFAAAEPATAAHLVTALHKRQVPVYDQGQTGSCTGQALAGALSTDPFTLRLAEPDAVALYSAATHLDGLPGVYPPDDTGSSGLAVCKAAKRAGQLTAYRHAFSLNAALAAIAQGPVIAGFGWYDSFDAPGAHGLITITPDAQVRGGHETCWVGVDVTARTIRGCNSWGTGWGDGGYYTLGWDDAHRLLAERGDVTVPVA